MPPARLAGAEFPSRPVARLLIRGESFERVSSDAYWESEFERLVLRESAVLYPEYHFVPFKTEVESEYGVAKPDFALVERQYRRWWVVEAELAHHSLSAHVLPQVEKLAAGLYGPSHATYLHDHGDALDRAALANMMKGAQPRVLVVVNAPRPTWVAPLSRFDALLAVVEIFRSSRGEHVLRVNGDYPSPPANALSQCRWDSQIRRFLLIESPAALETPANGRYEIEYDGAVTEWTRVESKDRVWLNPLKATALPPGGRFVLSREAEKLVLRVLAQK